MRIGTRKSVMALAQTEEIARRLTAAVPGLEAVSYTHLTLPTILRV